MKKSFFNFVTLCIVLAMSCTFVVAGATGFNLQTNYSATTSEEGDFQEHLDRIIKEYGLTVLPATYTGAQQSTLVEYDDLDKLEADLEDLRYQIQCINGNAGQVPIAHSSTEPLITQVSSQAATSKGYLTKDLADLGPTCSLEGTYTYQWHWVGGLKEATEFTDCTTDIIGFNPGITFTLTEWLGYPISDHWIDDNDQWHYVITDSSSEYYLQWEGTVFYGIAIPDWNIELGFSDTAWGYYFGGGLS